MLPGGKVIKGGKYVFGNEQLEKEMDCQLGGHGRRRMAER